MPAPRWLRSWGRDLACSAPAEALLPTERRRRLDERHSPWRHASIAGLFDEVAAAFPNRPVVLGEAGATSYAAMRAWSARLAGGLAAAGLGAGDHIALLMVNGPAFVAARLAVSRLGAVAVPLNFNLLRDELADVLGQSRAVALLTMATSRGRDHLAELAAIDTGALRIFVHAPDHPHVDDFAALAGGAEFAGMPATPATLTDIIFTSGTTGQPKGVMLTGDMVLRTAFASARVRAFEDGCRLLFAAPMYHVHGYVECLIASLFAGGAVIPQEKFDARLMLSLAVRYAASEISGVPMVTERLLEAARADGFHSPALRTVFNTGGANRDGIWQDIRDVLAPAEVVTAYGMTETTASTTCTLPEGSDTLLVTTNGALKDAGAAGGADRVLARYKTIDPLTGGDLPVGMPGELVVQGRAVSAGYWEKPDETAAAFTTDGWLRTGDLGRIDGEGNLTLTGRVKDSYRCGGETVMPREIEALLETHPSVAQAVVVGMADAKMGEVGCACIVAAAGVTVDPMSLVALCAAGLARFKVPAHILVMTADDIPLTATGRPQRFRLAEIVRARLGLA